MRIAHAADAQPPELEPRFTCDGFVTNEPDVPLAVFMADCLPALLHDPVAGVIGAVHCGWRGSVADILGAAVAQMCALGAHPADIRAAIGPGIGACCFEVGPEVVAAAEALLHEPLGTLVRPRADGKALLDLKGVNARRLAQLGVPAGQIAVSDACTMCRPDVFWSHRATDGRRGVQAAVITL
ncbi:MAG: peptidoglycan editing factor PgeF [Oscillospiraceae bacterium]